MQNDSDYVALRAFPPSERRVLALLMRGYSDPEISRKLRISCHTTKNYVARMLRRTGLSNRITLAVTFARWLGT